MLNLYTPFMAVEFIQMVYCLVLALPIFVPPLARMVNIKCMFGKE